MPSLHRTAKSPFWYASFKDKEGRWKFKSTKTSNKLEAEIIAKAWDKTATLAASNALTPERARQIITEGVKEIADMTNQDAGLTPCSEWFDEWLAVKKISVDATSYPKYKKHIERFKEFIAEKSDAPLTLVGRSDIARFRDYLGGILSTTTANRHISTVRDCLSAAVRDGVIDKNPGIAVQLIPNKRIRSKKPFTMEQLKAVVKKSRGDEWFGAVLCGLYLTQRLGDICSLKKSQIDFKSRIVSIKTDKTDRLMDIPIAAPLLKFFKSLPKNLPPDAPIFPRLFRITRKSVSKASQDFRKRILEPLGLVEKQTERLPGCRKRVNPLTFHSLRHTATTMLKKAGVSKALAQGVIGHDSEAINDNYTHLSAEDLRPSIDKLPDVTQ